MTRETERQRDYLFNMVEVNWNYYQGVKQANQKRINKIANGRDYELGYCNCINLVCQDSGWSEMYILHDAYSNDYNYRYLAIYD